MAITNLNSLSVAKRSDGGGNVLGMGTVSITGPLSVSGTLSLSGVKTYKGPNTFANGATFSHGAKFAGTVSLQKAVVVTGVLTLAGTVTDNAKLLVTGAGKLYMRSNITTTGALAGIRTIATGGSAVITTYRLNQTSVIQLTPMVNTAILNANATERYSARSAVAHTFKMLLRSAGGTAVTGRIGWMIVN